MMPSWVVLLAREDKVQFELEHHNSKDEKAYLYLMLNVYI